MRDVKLSPAIKWCLELLESCTGYGPAGVDNKATCRSMRALCRRGLAVEGPDGIFRRIERE